MQLQRAGWQRYHLPVRGCSGITLSLTYRYKDRCRSARSMSLARCPGEVRVVARQAVDLMGPDPEREMSTLMTDLVLATGIAVADRQG